MDNVLFDATVYFQGETTAHPKNSRTSFGCGNCGIYRRERSIEEKSTKKARKWKFHILWENELVKNNVLTWHCEVRCCGYRMKTKLTSYDLPKLQIPTPEVHRIGLKVKRKEGREYIFKKLSGEFYSNCSPRIRAPYLIFSGWQELRIQHTAMVIMAHSR